MRKKLISLLLAGLVTFTSTLHAEMSFAQKISYDMVKGVISAVLGKEIGKLFGEGAITKEDLDRSLDEHFEKFGYSLYVDKVNNLKQAVGDFSPVNINVSQLSQEQLDAKMIAQINLKLNSIQNVIQASEQLASKIEGIINTNNFWQVMPTYIFVSNIRLAFLAEKHALDPTGGWDQVMASRAVHAMNQYREYWLKYMTRPEGELQCVFKDFSQKYYLPLTLGSPIGGYNSEKVVLNPLSSISKYDPLINVRLCQWKKFNNEKLYKRVQKDSYGMYDLYNAKLSSIGMKEMALLPNEQFYKSKGLFHPFMTNKNQWWFVYRKENSDGQYWIAGPFDNKEQAEYLRFKNTYKSYTDELGPMRHTIIYWHTIAKNFGTASTKEDADRVIAKYE